jgi:hypothetical protein
MLYAIHAADQIRSKRTDEIVCERSGVPGKRFASELLSTRRSMAVTDPQLRKRYGRTALRDFWNLALGFSIEAHAFFVRLVF